MNCWHCQRTAVATCRFCGRAVCENHVTTRPFILELLERSEPVRALVARAIDVVLQNLESAPPVVHCVAAELRVLDWRTNHVVDQIELRASPPMVDALPVSAPHSIGPNPWKAMRDACAFDGFGAAGVPAAPPPLQPLGTPMGASSTVEPRICLSKHRSSQREALDS